MWKDIWKIRTEYIHFNDISLSMEQLGSWIFSLTSINWHVFRLPIILCNRRANAAFELSLSELIVYCSDQDSFQQGTRVNLRIQVNQPWYDNHHNRDRYNSWHTWVNIYKYLYFCTCLKLKYCAITYLECPEKVGEGAQVMDKITREENGRREDLPPETNKNFTGRW
jgi:hypothetical protein